MRRRDFIALGGATLLFPKIAFGQAPAKVPFLAHFSTQEPPEYIDAFVKGLAELGYVDGRTIHIQFFQAMTTPDLPTLAPQVLAAKPDIIFAYGLPAAQALAALTKTIPIVFYTASDPVALGLIANLARPGGNLTGAVATTSAAAGKQLGLLKEAVPGLSRVALFEMSDNPVTPQIVGDVMPAAMSLGLNIIPVDVVEGGDFRSYFQQAKAANAQAIYFGSYTYFTSVNDGTVYNAERDRSGLAPTYSDSQFAANNQQVTNAILMGYLALEGGLPTVGNSVIATSGGLFGYGFSVPPLMQSCAQFVDAILKGRNPGDLAVELPMSFDFIVNLKTAKALGLTIPSSIQIQATQVVQ